MAQTNPGVIELEHSIGYSGEHLRSIVLHPNGKNYIYITGACVVMGDLEDPNAQGFLRGHDDTVTCVGVSPSGSFLASGQKGYNSDVLVWDLSSHVLRYRLSEHDHEVVCLDFSSDDRLLVSCGNSSDKKMFVWDCSTGCIVASTQLDPSPTICVKFGGFVKDASGRPTSNYQFVTAGSKKLVYWLLNPFTGEVQSEVLNTKSAVREFWSLDFTPAGERYLFAGTASGDFFMFDMRSLNLVCTATVCSRGVRSLVALTEESLLVGGGDGSLSIWHVQSSRCFEMNKINLVGSISGLSPSSYFHEVLVGTMLGFQYRVTLPDLSQVLLSENHTKPMTFVKFPEKVSDKFATASEDGTIRLWDGSDYKALSRCVVSKAGSPLCFVLNLDYIISGWEDGTVRAFRTDTGEQVWSINEAHRGGVSCITLSKNQLFFVTGGFEGEVRIWELRTREMVSHLKEHTSRVTGLKLLEDDVHLVTVSKDKSILTWDLRTDKRIAAQAQRIGAINCVDKVPEVSQVITAGKERRITKWDLRQTQPIASVEAAPGQGDEVLCLAISNSGRYLATGGEGMVMRLWDLNTLRLLGEGLGHSSQIVGIAWAYDDRQIATVGKDNCTMVWNIFL